MRTKKMKENIINNDNKLDKKIRDTHLERLTTNITFFNTMIEKLDSIKIPFWNFKLKKIAKDLKEKWVIKFLLTNQELLNFINALDKSVPKKKEEKE